MEDITIYTDGACSGNPGPGGWGAILMYKENKKEISGGKKDTTNNVMELTAVIEALKLLKYPCKVKLYSDSAYVENAFKQGWIYNWLKNNWKTSGKEKEKNKIFCRNYLNDKEKMKKNERICQKCKIKIENEILENEKK